MSDTEEFEPFPDGSWTILHLPPEYRHCQLSNYDWAAHPGLYSPVKKFVDEMDWSSASGNPPPHLLLTGDPGVGKTHIGVGLYRMGVLKFDAASCIWIDVSTFCTDVKRSWDSGQEDPMRLVEDARSLVVMDDIFGRDLSPWEINNVVARIVQIAYRSQAALVITDNHNTDYFRQKLLPHEMDRILANAEVFSVEGESWR